MSTIAPRSKAESPPAGEERRLERRVLILAPFGRDAREIGRVLREAGLESQPCADGDDLCARIDEGAATALIAEEALNGATRGRLADLLARQPDWSDLPLIIMLARGREDEDGWRALRGLEGTGHLTLLERPLRTATLVTAVRAGVESRRKQYQIRDELRARARAEASLEQERARLVTILQQLPAGVIVAEAPSGKLILGNEQVQRIWRHDFFPSEEIRQYGDYKGFHPDGRPYLPDEWPLARSIARGEVVEQEEIRFQRGDGSFGWLTINSAPIRDAEGRIVAGVVTFADITERKQAEEDLRTLNETLEDQVAARTAVAERRAESLRRLAAELSEAEHRERKRLARILHDDLQQLLLGAQMGLKRLERCERDLLGEEVKKLDELLQESMRTSRHLTRELSPPVLHSGTLPEVVHWLRDWFNEKHGMAIAIRADGDMPPAPEHLRVFVFHAVRELLLNAIKHSGRLEASISLDCDGKCLAVQVEDSGEGFDPEAVEVRLRQPDSYGLFNIRERLEALQGRLEIARSTTGGACFRLVLPVPADGAG
ncbi:MAG: PAS domain S-box protein [Planctomycetota bacterium]|nr:PAS domain S-box protein [Planctomycetota bacterium]